MAPKKRKDSSQTLLASAPAATAKKAKQEDDVATGSVVDPAEALRELTGALRDEGWRKALKDEFEKPYFADIAKFVAEERAAHLVHPAPDKVFEALNVVPFDSVRVVILGQDPYHEPGQAHGLCFSVLPGVKTPPSLVNMYKELVTDIAGFETPDHGYLLDWAKQGILMLNATLTVRGGHQGANSHAKCGWQKFTDEVIRRLSERAEGGIVFLLWGGFAQKKGKIIDATRHVVLEAAHPSPLSVTKWRGCKTFSKCNEALKARGHAEINWKLGAAAIAPTGSSPQQKGGGLMAMLRGKSSGSFAGNGGKEVAGADAASSVAASPASAAPKKVTTPKKTAAPKKAGRPPKGASKV